ncbi:MAG: sugar phosphate isomerase/epimerase family protein [Chloroflexota bacterium]
MRVGVFSNSISGGSPEEVAERSRAAGVEAVQLRLEWPGLDVEGRAADRARLRRAYEAAGIEVAALAAYTNLFDPRLERRRANRARLEHLIQITPEFGASIIVTETGSYNPDDSWSDHARNHTPEAWEDLLAVTDHLVRCCEQAGVVLAYEPYVNTALSSAAEARRLADDIGSSALAFVFDGAGLVTPQTLPNNKTITEEALALLRGRIALAHADDVRYEDGKARWLPLGWGALDAAAVFTGLLTVGFVGALIVEHLAESLVPEALAFCREQLADAEGGG